MSATAEHPAVYVSLAPEKCDGCAARALFQITLASGGQLLMCGHHTKRNMDQLVASGALVEEIDDVD